MLQKKRLLPLIKKLLVLPITLAFTPSTYAHCPLCTAAVGVAAVSAKYYGVNDSIIGLFSGAFAISVGLWIGLKIIKKTYIRFQLPIIIILSYALTILPVIYSLANTSVYVPVLWFGSAGSLFNKVYFVDKMLLGSIIGSIVTLIGYWLHIGIKRVRGSVLFPFQGIAITVGLLLTTALIQYFIFG